MRIDPYYHFAVSCKQRKRLYRLKKSRRTVLADVAVAFNQLVSPFPRRMSAAAVAPASMRTIGDV